MGGGLSIKGFDFGLLLNENTIGCNTPLDKFNPTILLSIDDRFWEEAILDPAVQAHPAKVFPQRGRQRVLAADILILPLLGRPSWSMALAEGLGDGDNSGYSALNLAFILGANPIYLLGFDMKGEDGKTVNWYRSIFEPGDDACYKKWKFHFQWLVASGKIGHRKIINLNPGSKLDCFERRPCGDVLCWRYKI